MAQCFCPRCKRTMEDSNFYTRRNGEKFDLCKKCATAHVNNWEPETYTWILEGLDVPYVPSEWDTVLRKAYEKDPSKAAGSAILGKYLSKMKLNQFKNYGWDDSEMLVEKIEEEQRLYGPSEEKMQSMQAAYQEGAISEAQYKTYMAAYSPVPQETIFTPPPPEEAQEPQYSYEVPALELTPEDISYLALKWGRLYKPEDWVALEKFYDEMMASFDIQGAARIDTLKMICKTSLKMNQAIDCGDIETYQKLSRVYDSMMKSAKFTAAQNKEEQGEFVDSIGELVALCEKEGFIPRYCTDIPQDKVDKTLDDMNKYVYKLVTQDMGLGQQIEDAIKKIEIQKQMDADAEVDIFDEDAMQDAGVLADADFQEYYDDLEEQKEQDLLTMLGGV